MNNKKTITIKIIITIVTIIALCLAIYLPLKLTGSFEKINNPEDLKNIILDGGTYSYLIFFAIQFLQVTFLPIPAVVTTVAGSLVFGPFVGSLISYFAVMLASMFSFFLGRKVGRKTIYWIVGEETAKKWLQKLGRGKYFFFLMMLFPVFPDDILCLLAGATTISFKFFFITNLITRPLAIFLTSYLGGGHIIPFSGWGIPVWILGIILVVVAFILTYKFQDKIELFMNKINSKFSRKNNDKLKFENVDNKNLIYKSNSKNKSND